MHCNPMPNTWQLQGRTRVRNGRVHVVSRQSETRHAHVHVRTHVGTCHRAHANHMCPCERYIPPRVQDACPTTRVLHTRAHRHATIETSQGHSGAVFRKRACGTLHGFDWCPKLKAHTRMAIVFDSAVTFTSQWPRHCTESAEGWACEVH